jgi:hypothetical protein
VVLVDSTGDRESGEGRGGGGGEKKKKAKKIPV